MQKKTLILGAVALIGVLGVGIAHGAGTLVMTSKLGVAVGTAFRFDGQIRTRSLFVRDGFVIDGPITVDTKTAGKLNPVTITGNLAVSGTVTGTLPYTNTTTGVSATTVQGALDQLGMPLAKLISGTDAGASATSVTTWKGNAYDDCSTTFRKSAEITAVFTPTSATDGTYSVSPINILESSDQVCNATPTATFTGTYSVVAGMLMAKPSTGSSVVLQPIIHGTTMTFIDAKSGTPPQAFTTLVRQ